MTTEPYILAAIDFDKQSGTESVCGDYGCRRTHMRMQKLIGERGSLC